MEWVLAWALRRIMGTLVRIEIRGRDGFLAHYVANRVEWRATPAGSYWVVAYQEPCEVAGTIDIIEEPPVLLPAR